MPKPEVMTTTRSVGRLGLTVSEVASELGVSENTVRRWSDAGHLHAYRTPGGQRRFSRQAINAFLRSVEDRAR
jgi:excisionase family DNA binding protein